MTFRFTIHPIAECSILIRFNAKPSKELSLYIGHCNQVLSKSFSELIMNVTPSYDSILVDYLPHRVDMAIFISLLEEFIKKTDSPEIVEDRITTLPAFYHESVGLDLHRYYNEGLSLEDIIQLHTEQEYTVGAIGFAPGFAFLTGVHSTLQKPRLESPRVNVAKGSIAIANNQTAVYPNPSPGGWNIIGNCPIDLYNPNSEEMTPFSIGATVRFRSITKDEFLSLGGVL
ncbi:allophanate hydrolase subunit 1 [Vibrio amylolyticus]|uniref:5-oxoprolinase subunit B family protein n=1 Tax=Vibrio amylolyticus TaxID=2847292 RepID=UPI00355375AE